MSPSRDIQGEPMYPSGEPDPDELTPPGITPLQPGWRPPRGRGGGPESAEERRSFSGILRILGILF